MGITNKEKMIFSSGGNHVFPLRYQDDIPHDVTDYAQSLVDKLFEHPKMVECEFDIIFVSDNTSSSAGYRTKGNIFYNVDYLLQIRIKRLSNSFRGDSNYDRRCGVASFFCNVLKISKTSFDSTPEGSWFYIALDKYVEWKRDKQLGALMEQNEGLNERINELTTHVNNLTKLLETMWMHPNMPGGREQLEKAVESYNEK